MQIKQIIKSSLVSLAMFGLIYAPSIANAKQVHHHVRLHRTSRHNYRRIRRNKRKNSHYSNYKLGNNHKYLVSSNAYGGQTMDNEQFNELKHHSDSFGYGGDLDGSLVHIVKSEKVNGKTFDQFKDSFFNGYIWTYDGNLSKNKHSHGHPINLDKFKDKFDQKLSDNQNQEAKRNIPEFTTQMRQQTLKDINHDRAQHGVAPLTENPQIDQVANLRAQQISTDFSHYDANHNNALYAAEDANKLGFSFGDELAENISGADIGDTGMVDDPKSYHNHNGNEMADMADDAMMNYDKDSNWGHRQNILDSSLTEIGIGVYSNPSDPNSYYLAEDFK